MPSIPFFSKKLPISTKQIEQAIAHLETQTSAELRVVVESKNTSNGRIFGQLSWLGTCTKF